MKKVNQSAGKKKKKKKKLLDMFLSSTKTKVPVALKWPKKLFFFCFLLKIVLALREF